MLSKSVVRFLWGSCILGAAVALPDESIHWRWLLDRPENYEYNSSLGTGHVQCIAKNVNYDTRFNTAFAGDGGMTGGIYTWNITMESAHGFSVGITNEHLLLPGYGVKGMYFNGVNLSDGGALLASGYGSTSTSGRQDIQMQVEITSLANNHTQQGMRLKVWFVHNNKPLGLGFDVQTSNLTLPLYPAISFKRGGASASITVLHPIPEELLQRSDPNVCADDKFLGSWAAASPDAGVLSDLHILLSHGRAAEQSKDIVVYSVSSRVCNNMNMQLTCRRDTDPGLEQLLDCKPGMVASTMMLCMRELMNKEKLAAQFLESIQTLKIAKGLDASGHQSGDVLTVHSGDKELKLRRFVEPFEPVQLNVFDRPEPRRRGPLAIVQ